MKCVSIMQPWASLIIAGHKHYETRGWKTSHRGPLLVHASGRKVAAALILCQLEPFLTALRAAGYHSEDQLPFGRIIGRVELVDCLDAEAEAADVSEWERSFGDFAPGRWAWKLINPQVIHGQGIIKGKLGIFETELTYEPAGDVCGGVHAPPGSQGGGASG